MNLRMTAQLRLFLRMTGLTVLWCAAVGLANHAAEGSWPTIAQTVAFLVNCAKAGAVLGLIAVAVALLFGRVNNVRRFKLAMALCISALPACFTFIILIMLWMYSVELSFTDVIQLLPLLSNLPFAYWFSQIVARKYLREISSEKRKAKPTPGGV